jgi:hypothetical protein
MVAVAQYVQYHSDYLHSQQRHYLSSIVAVVGVMVSTSHRGVMMVQQHQSMLTMMCAIVVSVQRDETANKMRLLKMTIYIANRMTSTA